MLEFSWELNGISIDIGSHMELASEMCPHHYINPIE